MFKIMVADDEAIFREYLRTVLRWEHHGFEICCEARNGAEALEMIKEHKPDIALVDINMPFIDGLSLVEKINGMGSNMAIVLITGHSEFEYARRAVRLGVVDYILKPFDREELLLVLLKIKGNLLKIQEERDVEKRNRNLIRERLLNILISDENISGDAELEGQMKQFGIALGQQSYVAASIEIDELYRLWNNTEEISLWKFAVSNIIRDIFGFEGSHIVFNGPEGRIVSITGWDGKDKENAGYLDKYKRACDLVKRYLKFSITIGIGNPVHSIRAVRNSYMESLVALQNKVVSLDSKVIQASSLGSESMSIGFYPNEINEKLIIALRTNDSEDVASLLEDVFSYIRKRRLSFEYVYVVVMGLVSLCLSYVNEIGKNIEQVFGKDFSPYSEVKSKSSLEALQQWSVKLFETALNFSDEGRNTRSKKLVESVREYILENYHDSSLSVERIAQGIYINSSYLRKIFKKELNMSVNDYIVNLRLQKSKELIGNGNIKLSDISEMIGYNDAGYFSKSFKKKFGFSPSEYESLLK